MLSHNPNGNHSQCHGCARIGLVEWQQGQPYIVSSYIIYKTWVLRLFRFHSSSYPWLIKTTYVLKLINLIYATYIHIEEGNVHRILKWLWMCILMNNEVKLDWIANVYMN